MMKRLLSVLVIGTAVTIPFASPASAERDTGVYLSCEDSSPLLFGSAEIVVEDVITQCI